MDFNLDARKLLSAILLSTGLNALVVLYAQEILEISAEFEPLHFGPVLLFTAISAIGAYAFLEALHQYTERTYEIFLGTSATVLILSYIPIIYQAPTFPGAGETGLVILSLTHVVAGIAITGSLLEYENLRE